MKKHAVIGIGNPLRCDDAIGILLLEKLLEKKDSLPENVEFIDGGTGGMNLLHILEKYNNVLIIDAVDFEGKPGDFKIFNTDEVISHKTPVRFSTHETDFIKIIKILEKIGKRPDEILVFGIQPKNISFGQNLSGELIDIIQDLFLKLEEEINSFCLK